MYAKHVSYCLCITGNLLDTATLTANSNQKLYAAVPTSLISQLGDDPAPALGGTPVVTHTINLLNYLAPGLVSLWHLISVADPAPFYPAHRVQLTTADPRANIIVRLPRTLHSHLH